MGRKRAQKTSSGYRPGTAPIPSIENIFAELFAEGAAAFFDSLGGRARPIRATYHPGPPPAIPEDMLKKMIFLCHPDKHGNSETAGEVTRWLLEQRKK